VFFQVVFFDVAPLRERVREAAAAVATSAGTNSQSGGSDRG
jgi:hypothetical protein